MRSGSLILLIGILMLSSCKTNEPLLATNASGNGNVHTYVILIRLKDNNGTMNQVMSTVQQMISAMQIKVREIFTLSDNFKEVQVMANFLNDERLDSLRYALFKIDGVLEMNIYSSEKFAAEQLEKV